ncbi:MAG: single-stranded DNA-binding protein [Patescibacteria group bacterium]|jgi:single-strand DNA-binding protein
MNRVTLIGNLTRDPEVKYTAKENKAISTFTLAVNTGYGEKRKTDYIYVVCWQKLAEIVGKRRTYSR